jgi:hypothetical protein
MSSHQDVDVTRELEDLTDDQIQKLLRRVRIKRLLKEVDEDDLRRASKENDDLVSLHESHKGPSKAPKVKRDDFAENDLDPPPEAEEEEALAKADKKKGKK